MTRRGGKGRRRDTQIKTNIDDYDRRLFVTFLLIFDVIQMYQTVN